MSYPYRDNDYDLPPIAMPPSNVVPVYVPPPSRDWSGVYITGAIVVAIVLASWFFGGPIPNPFNAQQSNDANTQPVQPKIENYNENTIIIIILPNQNVEKTVILNPNSNNNNNSASGLTTMSYSDLTTSATQCNDYAYAATDGTNYVSVCKVASGYQYRSQVGNKQLVLPASKITAGYYTVDAKPHNIIVDRSTVYVQQQSDGSTVKTHVMSVWRSED